MESTARVTRGLFRYTKKDTRNFKSRVWFTASQTRTSDFASLSSEFLHHELGHAFRQTSGRLLDQMSMPTGLEDFQDWEEFFAVILTNVHISDA